MHAFNQMSAQSLHRRRASLMHMSVRHNDVFFSPPAHHNRKPLRTPTPHQPN